jgi:hypothetical protein
MYNLEVKGVKICKHLYEQMFKLNYEHLCKRFRLLLTKKYGEANV